MNTPQRIQRKRTKGWRMPPTTVYVGRPTKWGNPFKVGAKNPSGTITADNRHAVAIYSGFAFQQPRLVAAARAELKGMDLACWCDLCEIHADGRPLGSHCPYCEKCHADVLLEIANQCSEETP